MTLLSQGRIPAIAALVMVSNLSQAALVTSEYRHVQTSGNLYADNSQRIWHDSEAATVRSLFDFALSKAEHVGQVSGEAYASQLSQTANDYSFSGQGQAYAYASAFSPSYNDPNINAQVSSESFYEIRFTLAQSNHFDLLGFLNVDSSSDDFIAGASFNLYNTDVSSGLNWQFGNDPAQNDFNEDLTLSGTLLPGEYVLQANAYMQLNTLSSPAGLDGLAQFNFNLQLTPTTEVPLPAAGWLFLSALFGLAAKARSSSAGGEKNLCN
jgi:hypothetical protein